MIFYRMHWIHGLEKSHSYISTAKTYLSAVLCCSACRCVSRCQPLGQLGVSQNCRPYCPPWWIVSGLQQFSPFLDGLYRESYGFETCPRLFNAAPDGTVENSPNRSRYCKPQACPGGSVSNDGARELWVGVTQVLSEIFHGFKGTRNINIPLELCH